ncbi:uroporphyrinogen-III C-methyltransferase [Fulvivirga ulvae]|uniref:uroporphyrinogen-III C-methyltransferase n=1 Tax=Fulvivirga ulvae TaxID=2904245 RepID=UPI001F16150A|nr:uroporphyrinogen-III C-methyltransferase [Fulvivirga ulvae]UII34436.1 uroporphyrinogen-III C-methyltransferase [Fulvivirga ulvae]
MGKLILVGAGPGDADLITLKGLKALKNADVVLYDALANSSLLEYCKESCIKIYVGKKAGLHQYQQIYINAMIVDYATRYNNVVRLKGGDPFVFGRGHEELEHAEQNGIEVEVIPGISSSLAVPATNHIPLTKRGVNESFWVVTGTTSNGSFSKDMAYAARSSATVVILMGMKNLKLITELFSYYRDEYEPVGIIQNGTHNNQKEVFGYLGNIVSRAEDLQIKSPAIIIIGQVAAFKSRSAKYKGISLIPEVH